MSVSDSLDNAEELLCSDNFSARNNRQAIRRSPSPAQREARSDEPHKPAIFYPRAPEVEYRQPLYTADYA